MGFRDKTRVVAGASGKRKFLSLFQLAGQRGQDQGQQGEGDSRLMVFYGG